MDSMPEMTSLEELLASDVKSNSQTSTAVLVRKDNYRDLVKFGNVTSFSMQSALKSCPRKFQLLKMGADTNEDQEREGNVDFAFGHAVGAGVACIDAGGTQEEATWEAFLAWNIDLFAEKIGKNNRDPKKAFHHALWALACYRTFREEETDLFDYEVVKNEGTIAVDFEDGNFYVGHIDTILRHKDTGRYKVKENKTTVFSAVHPALYENSDQALSYAIVLDSLGASEYDVLYTIYSTSEQRWLSFEFTKTPRAKAEWVQGQFFLNADIAAYTETNFFPKNGASCYTFNRPCEFFGTCDFNTGKVFGKRFSELRRASSLAEIEEVEKIDYAFKVSEILETQREKTGKNIL